MLNNLITPQIAELVNIFAILFAVFHLLVGLALTVRINRMNAIIKTSTSGCITLITYGYIAVLLLVIVLLIMI